jgi:hypothetical protein
MSFLERENQGGTDIKEEPVGYVKVVFVKEHGMIQLSIYNVNGMAHKK